MKKDAIDITTENINDIKYEDVMFLTLAEGGAMGEAGGIYILLKDKKLYHANYVYDKFDVKKLYPVFPPLKTISCGFCMVSNLDENWSWFDMGMGNYIFVRKENQEEFEKEVEKITPPNDEYPPAIIYKNWLKIANKILK